VKGDERGKPNILTENNSLISNLTIKISKLFHKQIEPKHESRLIFKDENTSLALKKYIFASILISTLWT